MERRDFSAMMRYLKKRQILSTQKELAEVLKNSPATVSDLKKRGYVTDKWLKNLANTLADHGHGETEHLYQLFLENIPEYDIERERQHREETGISGRDFLLPSREKCEEILSIEGDEYGYYSDIIAINKKAIKSKKDIAVIKYPKTNMSPNVNPSDVLVIKKCNEFEGSGYYLLKEFKNIKIIHISSRLNSSDSFSIRTGDFEDEDVSRDSLCKLEIIARVIFLFRDTTLSDI